MRKKPEILAPAGSMQGLMAAVAAGCDAVYIGGTRFGARAYADNPDGDEMLEAIAYCHRHHVKIYMTVNTLLKEKEISESLFSYLLPYYEAGLDAVIVQDVGVLHFIREHFPSLPVHASTQMTLTQGKATKLLEDCHVDRIVPARELSLAELKQMRKETDVELEVFVHGALCYCYSGQCLFSSMLGGRSGNRGRCAQPCRMPYFIDGKRDRQGDYLLSPKELCNLPYLPELIEAGIDSFKIEGRMKRPEYAAFVTAVYRKYVDAYFSMGAEAYRQLMKHPSKEWMEDMRCLAELYNREGFTQGYLEEKAGMPGTQKAGQKGQMLARKRPKHGGVCVGRVLSVGRQEVIYETIEKLSAQDVVEFRNEQQQPVYEYTLGREVPKGKKVTARYQKGSKIAVGDRVYRTKDAELLTKVREKFLTEEEKLPVKGRLLAKKNQPLQLSVRCKNVTSVCSGDVCQEANKQQATKEAVEKVLKQTGGSHFYFETLEIELEENLFLPVGVLKRLRRQALDTLQKEMEALYLRFDAKEETATRETNAIEISDTTERKRIITASVMNQEQLTAVLSQKHISGVYVQTEQFSDAQIKDAFLQIKEKQKKAYLVFPVIFRAKVWERFAKIWQQEDSFLRCAWDGYLAKNMESLTFLFDIVKAEPETIRLDHNMYVMNREAYRFWQEKGIEKVTLPLEVTKEEAEQLSFLKQAEMQVYGKIPLMVSAQCVCANTQGCVINHPQKQCRKITMKDAKGRTFVAVNYCKYCYNVIYQEEALAIQSMAEKDNAFCDVAFRYFFTTESGSEVTDILQGKITGRTQSGHWEQGVM
ncbi:MAG: U32 family peptidase [Butyribacter sp.]|nr:U32 family peptidase [bacterium]MDY3854929.1 U32 family peptidase [Butyribacter sp.]